MPLTIPNRLGSKKAMDDVHPGQHPGHRAVEKAELEVPAEETGTAVEPS